MGRGIQAALAALGAKPGARGAAAQWSLDLAALDLSSVFGGALIGEAIIEVPSEEALSFRQPPELAALGQLWVPGLETGAALVDAVSEAHESLRARLDNDLETLARLGIDARLALPVARARGTIQLGADEVALEIDDAGELVVTHIGAARVQQGQGRALGAPEDTEAEEALLRITRVVHRVRERGLLETPAQPEEEGIEVDVDVDSLDGDPAGETGANVWSEDEHTHAVGESSGVDHTQHLSDEQLAAVQDALSEDSDHGDAPDMSDEAEPIEEPADTGSLPIGGPTLSASTEPQPLLPDDEDDVRTVSISLRQQSSLLRALDAIGKQDATSGTTEQRAADERSALDRALADDGSSAGTAAEPPAAPAQVPVAHEAEPAAEDRRDDDGGPSAGQSLADLVGEDEDEDDEADRTLTIAPAPPAPPLSVGEMPDLPEGSGNDEPQPTVVVANPPPNSVEAAGALAMPAPTAAVKPVQARVPSDEIESIARGFDDVDDLDDASHGASPPPAAEEGGEETAGYRFDKPVAAHTLDDAPPATNVTVSQPEEPPVPGPSMEEPSMEEPLAEGPAIEEPMEAGPRGGPPAAAAAVDSLALLPPDDDSPPTRNYRLDAEGFDDGTGSVSVSPSADAGVPPFAAADGGLPADMMEPADTAAIAVPEGLPGAPVPAMSDVEGDAIASAPVAVAPALDERPEEPKTRPFVPADLFGFGLRTTDQDDPAANPDDLEARADALEAEARALRLRAGALRSRRAAVTMVPSTSGADISSGTGPPPPMMDDARSALSSVSSGASSLPSMPSIEVHAIEVPSDDVEGSVTDAPAAPRRLNSAEEGVSLAEVRAALGALVPNETTRIAGVELPPPMPASVASGDGDVFADAFADGPAAAADAAEAPEPDLARRSIVLVVEDARARDRLKRHLSSRFDELFEAADAASAVELPNLTNLSALVFVRPRPDARTRLGLTHLETLERRPRVLVISSDHAFDEMPSVDQRLPLGQRASEVAQQVLDGLTSLGVTPLPG